MIGVIDEDVILRFAVYHLPTPSSNRSFVAHKNLDEVFSSDLVTSVVLQCTLRSINLVEHSFFRQRVGSFLHQIKQH